MFPDQSRPSIRPYAYLLDETRSIHTQTNDPIFYRPRVLAAIANIAKGMKRQRASEPAGTGECAFNVEYYGPSSNQAANQVVDTDNSWDAVRKEVLKKTRKTPVNCKNPNT